MVAPQLGVQTCTSLMACRRALVEVQGLHLFLFINPIQGDGMNSRTDYTTQVTVGMGCSSRPRATSGWNTHCKGVVPVVVVIVLAVLGALGFLGIGFLLGKGAQGVFGSISLALFLVLLIGGLVFAIKRYFDRSHNKR